MKTYRKTSACILAFASAATLLLIAGCRQDMQNEPKMIPQRGTHFFADGRSARPQVVDTVARGQLYEDQYFYTGLVNGKEQNAMPYPVTLEVLARGQERFNLYCTPCHSRVGNGDGMIVQRGYKPASNFHDPKHINQPLSFYFYVMTNGYGAMPDYSSELRPVDRWAIAAYIRALQLSQNATLADVPPGTQVKSLESIAKQEGLPASYAGPWPMTQNTTVYGVAPIGTAAGAPALPVEVPAGIKSPARSSQTKSTASH